MSDASSRFQVGRSDDGRPSRVRVTSPRRTSSRKRLVSITSEIDSQTVVGDVYVRSLVRSQLRLALAVVVLLAGTLGGLPLLLRLVPTTRTLTAHGIPLTWLVLGVLVYPAMVLIGWVYVRQAERNEDDFTALVVDPSEPEATSGPETDIAPEAAWPDPQAPGRPSRLGAWPDPGPTS